ncbi:uncharacterized protein LOC113282550 [Papaver somniferum]|uniref:uncharacterized protein LOC113282550 n=1 Tax=Papaver somniferum TaxID=3469 RepID=UPI000E6FB2FB|nr:uncharacterized protein LOC113282550 [Papaver somniferum]
MADTEVLRLSGDMVDETIVVEPNGIHPTTSTKFRAMIMMNVNTHMTKVIHAANAAGVLVGKTRRINMESTIRHFGPVVEPVILPIRNPQELVDLFMQHGH